MTSRPHPGHGHIVLIGMRGSGKTTVGRRLAKALGLRHIDTDDMVVEAAGRTIAEIFADEGVLDFRRREREAVTAAVLNERCIISVGGGAILDMVNVQALRASGFTVWLTAPASVLYERVQGDADTESTRPALTDLDGLAEMAALLQEREALYRQFADLELDVSQANPDEVAAAIVTVISGA